jgi:hypothetical protein
LRLFIVASLNQYSELCTGFVFKFGSDVATVAWRPGGNVTEITPHVAGFRQAVGIGVAGATADDAMHQLRYRQCRCQHQRSQRDHDCIGQLFAGKLQLEMQATRPGNGWLALGMEA